MHWFDLLSQTYPFVFSYIIDIYFLKGECYWRICVYSLFQTGT